MRIIYPFVERFPEALAALPADVEQIDVSADEQAYWRLLRDLWKSGEDFAIVEQDMVVPLNALASFANCRREWCAVPYWMYGSWGAWHGVTRYRGGLTRRLRELPEAIRCRDWPTLDSAWINHLREAGMNEAHWHWPPATHLNRRHPEPVGPLPVGQYLADLTDDGPLYPYRRGLRFTMTDGSIL